MSYKEWALANPTKTYGYQVIAGEIAAIEANIARREDRIKKALNGDAAGLGYSGLLSPQYAASHMKARYVQILHALEADQPSATERKAQSAEYLMGVEEIYCQRTLEEETRWLEKAKTELAAQKQCLSDYSPIVSNWRTETWEYSKAQNEGMEDATYLMIDVDRTSKHLAERLFALDWHVGKWKFNSSWFYHTDSDGAVTIDNLIFCFKHIMSIDCKYRIYGDQVGSIVTIGDSVGHFSKGGRICDEEDSFMLAWLTYLDYRWDYLIAKREEFDVRQS